MTFASLEHPTIRKYVISRTFLQSTLKSIQLLVRANTYITTSVHFATVSVNYQDSSQCNNDQDNHWRKINPLAHKMTFNRKLPQ